MKFELYKDKKLVMKKDHFYQIRMLLINKLREKGYTIGTYIKHKKLMEIAKETGYRVKTNN